MATLRLGAWDNKTVTVFAGYNAANRRLTGIQVINSGVQSLRAIVIHPTTLSGMVSGIFAPGTNTILGVVTTLQLFSAPDGDLALPTQLNIQYPAP